MMWFICFEIIDLFHLFIIIYICWLWDASNLCIDISIKLYIYGFVKKW